MRLRVLSPAAAIAFALGATTCAAPMSRGVGRAESGGAGAGAGGRNGGARVVASNVTRADYAGSESCRSCHAAEWTSWRVSPMHQMTRLASDPETAVRAPFDGRTFRFKDDTARLETRAGVRWMTLASSLYGAKSYAVTRVIGGHHREDFVGREDGRQDADEVVLPVSYLLSSRTFRYKGYSVMVHEREGLRAGPVWNRTCILCHNTAPYLWSALGAIAGPSARAYQGETVDPLLPRDRRWSFDVTDAKAFADAVSREAKAVGTNIDVDGRSPSDAALAAVGAMRNNLTGAHLVEVGIGCESCHGGAREHVADPRVLPSFEPHAPFLRTRPARTLDARALRVQSMTRACARCHQVLFTGYGWTWEGGTRHGAAASGQVGGSNINSGEARDLLLGACATAMTCVDCHDPHQRESGGRIARLDAGIEGDRVCTRCHRELEGDERVRAHTHHEPAGPGARCMNCHMPKKNMALDGTLTRYHRVGSPTDVVRVERDRPIECALCHGDKSVRAILRDVERLWGKRYDDGALATLYGDLEENVLVATLKMGKPHEQAVAMATLGSLGQRGRPWAQLVAGSLTHSYPIVRGYALRSLEAMLGEASPIDLSQDDERIKATAASWLAAHGVKE